MTATVQILAIEADKYNQQCPEEEPHSGTMCVVFQSTTAALQANKYQSNFSDPNKVTIPDQVRLFAIFCYSQSI